MSKKPKKKVLRECEICGNEFLTDAYQPSKSCSNQCFRELSRKVKLGKTHSLETKRKITEAANRRWGKK